MNDRLQYAAKLVIDEALLRTDRESIEATPSNVCLIASAWRSIHTDGIPEGDFITVLQALGVLEETWAVLCDDQRVKWTKLTEADLNLLVALDDCRHGDVIALEEALDEHETVGDILAMFTALGPSS